MSGTKVHSNYEDLLTFTRASKGHALRPVSYGDELVTNGTFDTDSDWTKSGGSTISSGEGHIVSTGSFVSLIQNIGAVTGKIYFVTIDVTVNSGAGVYIGIGGGAVDSRRYDATYTGTHSFALVAGPNDSNVQITRSGPTDSDVDNISVKEVTFDESDGTLTLFEHPDNIPRVEWDADRNRLGLLVEEARTNLITYSTPDSNWSTSALGTGVAPVVTLNNESAPDGTLSAAKVVLDTGAGTTSSDRSIYLAPSANVTATNSYSGSVWLKGEVGGEQIVMRHAGNATYSAFTLTTSWARYEVTETASSSLATMAIGLKGNQSDLTATIYVWGAQVEAGSFPTSYIKTTGATATRSADVASIPVADFGFNADAQSLLWEGSFLSDVAETDYLYNINSESGASTNVAESIRAFKFGDGDLNYRVSSSSVSSVNSEFTGVTENRFKVAFAIDSSSYSTTRDGGTVAEDTTVTVPTGLTTLHIAPDFFGHIKSIKYYPRRLSNAQLVELTS